LEWVAIVAGLVLAEYLFFTVRAGVARGRHEVAAPSMTGHAAFERAVRVQGNTLEQLIVFLPALGMFAHFVNPPGAALLGLVFLIGRALYWRGYVQDPPSRGPGFLISLVATVLLLTGGILGALAAAIG